MFYKIIIAFLLLISPCYAQTTTRLDQNTKAIKTGGTYFATTEAQLVAAQSDSATTEVVLVSPITLTSNRTLTKSLKVNGGAIITTTGYTLTLSGGFEAGDYQCFAGTGTVSGLAKSNVKWFGAVGDGTTDDTTAIQYAINSLPLNTADTGVLSPKGYANGGQIFIPGGRYKVTSTIAMKRGLHLSGESRESTQLLSFCTGSVLQYLDSGKYMQDEILIENLSIWQDSTVTPTSGAGIEIFFGDVSVQSTNWILRNLIIEGTYCGVTLGAGTWSSATNLNIGKCILYGIDVRYTTKGTGTSTSTTSATFQNCYTYLCASGVRIERGAYCSFVSCSSDSNTYYGYIITNGIGHSFTACGAEQNGSAGVYIEEAKGTVWNGYIINSVAGVVHGIVVKSAYDTTILGGSLYADGSAAGYGIYVDGEAGKITCIGTRFETNYSTNKINSVFKVLFLTAENGLVGKSNQWAIGATQQPEGDSTFSVSGYLDATSNHCFKSNGLHTAANATRNTAEYIQAITANTAVTYPQIIGTFIANASKGAASTIARTAGAYIAEQTQGATANANIMIDSGSGAVPVGNWSIYNESTRENLFKGPFRFSSSTGPLLTFGSGSPEGVVTAPPGSLYLRSDGSTGTSMYVKETGTGNTGWVAK